VDAKADLIRQYLAEIGRKGGSSKSERKAAAARENGKKGGRPRENPDGKTKGGEK
jgi:general stress protein YciG